MASPRRRLVLNPDARELEAQRIACSYLVKGCERALFDFGLIAGVAGGKNGRVAVAEARLQGETTSHAFAEMRHQLDVMRQRESRLRQELDEFVRLTVHDLHEPLRMVSCYVQLLERRYRGRLDSDADEFIHFAMDGAQRMQAMVDGLSALSRVTSA